MELQKVYFWASTIKDWKQLLKPDNYKNILLDSLAHLVDKKKVTVYAFVIMPNHIHLVWQLNEFNGMEMPHASFNKFTAHEIVKYLKNQDQNVLSQFKVDDPERQYRIWQRDPLTVLMGSRKKVEQKIDYIHNNPLQERWNLSESPESYQWSSARYYETGQDDFSFLTHYMEAF
jgi:REP element-mobilizing transposase RayT